MQRCPELPGWNWKYPHQRHFSVARNSHVFKSQQQFLTIRKCWWRQRWPHFGASCRFTSSSGRKITTVTLFVSLPWAMRLIFEPLTFLNVSRIGPTHNQLFIFRGWALIWVWWVWTIPPSKTSPTPSRRSTATTASETGARERQGSLWARTSSSGSSTLSHRLIGELRKPGWSPNPYH